MGPPFENIGAFDSDESPDESVLEDESSLGDGSSRELVADEEFSVADPGAAKDSIEGQQVAEADDATEGVAREITAADKPRGDGVRGLSAGTIMGELQRIEDEVRQLLERMDPRRKRRFGGTRRWYELEEDLIQWQFGDRFDESTLQRIRQLIAQRHYLYRQISFLAGTRPTWNT
ncbi:MAG: hypothetical protein AABZ47_14945 [Planctomycetota bacterium]